MSNRINVFVPEKLMARVRAANVENISNLCQQVLDAACTAVETGQSQTLTIAVTERVIRRLDVQRSVEGS